MYVLGVGQIGGLDSSAVLVKDGELRFAIEEERLARVKHIGGFPRRAIECCLAEEGGSVARPASIMRAARSSPMRKPRSCRNSPAQDTRSA